jgi:hypothetical protein
MGYIKFLDEDGVIDLEDMNEEQIFNIWIDLFNEQQKGK